MKRIVLSQGKIALVDDLDFERLNKFKWCAYRSGRTFYAMRARWQAGTIKRYSMHRFILGLPPNRPLVDHKNGNGLDNQRANLRVCSKEQNTWNRRKQKGSSIFKGVCRHQGKWKAQIRIKKEYVYLGVFEKEHEAALSYNEAALKYFGEFAYLNKMRKSA